jgi:hypothetical protein
MFSVQIMAKLTFVADVAFGVSHFLMERLHVIFQLLPVVVVLGTQRAEVPPLRPVHLVTAVRFHRVSTKRNLAEEFLVAVLAAEVLMHRLDVLLKVGFRKLDATSVACDSRK